jgi:type II pantothenate kinase
MDIVMGIDIGGSTTKAVGFHGDELIDSIQIEAGDRETLLFGTLGRFLHRHGVEPAQLRKLYLTGVGASFFQGDILGIPTCRVGEFEAIGRGGLRLSGLEEALVVSVGTGTAFVRAGKDGYRHLGGSGVGGGTLLGLSSLLINEDEIPRIAALAQKGVLGNVDLLIKAVTNQEIPALPSSATAANFGALKRYATREDLAAGVLSLVFQTVGMLSVFACINDTVRDIVLTGTVTGMPQFAQIMNEISTMCGVRFHIPERAAFATAIGAVMR